MSDVVSLERIQALASAARAAGTPKEQACPWPVDSPAGSAFMQAYAVLGEEASK